MEVLQQPFQSSTRNAVLAYMPPTPKYPFGKKATSGSAVINSNGAGGCVGNFKKRMAPQPPKPMRVSGGVSKNKVDDSYSTMSTMSVNSSSSPNSSVSEKSIKVKPVRKPLPRREIEPPPAVGWIRIYCGPDRSDFHPDDDPNRILQVSLGDSAKEIAIAMDLPVEYTIWLQIGGVRTRRLRDTECPLQIQENFLRKLGYHNEFRRSRMGIDVDLKWLIRFHIGPGEFGQCRGVTKSGNVEILKGLVSPQWKTRTAAIVGSKLIIFPGAFLFYYFTR